MNIENDFENKPIKTVVKWGCVAILVITLLGIVASFAGLIGRAATAPSRVASKTLSTDNIIQSYEWFYDVHAAHEARSAQVSEFEHLQTESVSDSDKSKLRTELSAMRQSCRSLVTKYNANSEKMNKSVFKGWSLPDSLSIATCEKSK